MRHSHRGFTLAEIIVAMSVLAIFSALAMPIFINSMKSLNFTNSRICLNRDVRYLTSRLMKEGRAAGQYIVYQSFSDRTTPVASGQSGNFVVLLKMDANGINVVETIGYYRHSTDNTVRRFEVAEAGTKPLPTAFPTSENSSPVVVEFAENNESSLLFYNMSNNGIVVSGKIHNNSQGKVTENGANPAAISTYNFTITPRG